MKKLTLLLLLVATTLTAQNHLTFKDIPITGTRATMNSKLVNLGYTLGSNDVLTGSFGGYSVEILPVTTQSNVVWKVIVAFPDKTSWHDLTSIYNDLKEALNIKYGQAKYYEFFREPYYLGDGYEMQALKNDKAVYVGFYELPLGTIVLKIHKNGFVLMEYEDAEGAVIKERESNIIKATDL